MVQFAAVDDVFHALSNPTRRKVLERLSTWTSHGQRARGAVRHAAPLVRAAPRRAGTQPTGQVEEARACADVRARTRTPQGRRRLAERATPAVGGSTGPVRPLRQTTQGQGIRIMSQHFTFDPKRDFAIERFIDAPTRLVWEALTKPEHLKEWYMPKAWGRVARAEMELRPGGILQHRHRRRRRPGGPQPRLRPRGRSDAATRLDVDAVPRLSAGRVRRHPDHGHHDDGEPRARARATSSRRCTATKRTSRRTTSRAFDRAPRSPSISSWST